MNDPKLILFVCVENSCRSQIAEAFARIHGKAKILPFSAGSRPGNQVNPKAIQIMQEVGYDLSNHHPKSLQQIPDLEYDYAITMGCGDECPFIRAKYRDNWNIPDPKELSLDEFRAVRDLIESKVTMLIEKVTRAKFFTAQ